MYRIQSSHGGTELAKAVQESYAEGQTDYAIEPIVLVDANDKAIGRIRDGDAVIFCCRRGEREVQLTEAFTDPDLHKFPQIAFNHLPFVILTLYHEKFKDLPIAFAPSKVTDTLAETISHRGLRQLHLSESEKFSHVTFFLNGSNNQSFAGETDVHIPSPKGIPAEQIPELSLAKVANRLEQALRQGYEFIVTNFANGDVIGHTQSREAKIKCAEFLDGQLGEVISAAITSDYLILVTADHGNLEELYADNGKAHVSHTANPVPFIFISPKNKNVTRLHQGSLADIAPTILSLMGIAQPEAMSGHSLVNSDQAIEARKVLLIILDGWGLGNDDETNPIYLANTPTWDKLLKQYPHTQLHASGVEVGLKPGKAGNSEAGHMNIGAGRVILQDDVRLDMAMQDGSFFTNRIFLDTIEEVKRNHSRLHLIGLLSEKSSHGSIEYPLALLRLAKAHQLAEVYIHLIFDGRSTDPGSAPDLLYSFEQKVAQIGIGKIVTGMGRGIALDRDGNYKRTRLAYDALVLGNGRKQNVNWA